MVERARQTETVIDQYGLARTVAFVHAADLWNGRVRFVDHNEKVFREKIDNRVRLRARRPSGQMARTILNALANAHRLQHLEIAFGSDAEPLGLEKLILRFQNFDPVFQLDPDRL